MANVNFYSNIKNLHDNGYLSAEQLTNALLQDFITVDEYVGFCESDDTALAGVKTVQVAKTKTLLNEYLASHPYTDPATGKKYSVTMEKQALLGNNIAVYQLAKAAGVEKVLKWNTTGDECVEFTEEELSALAIAIAAYVEPLVSYQQSQEVAIKNAATIEEVIAIETDYSTVGTNS